eukprot:TRINITY_DN2924_c0_g1_i1.p1 TRINITY_DN2924_c0_g1~~TRINITY_DN2924_c0_g1_i1.p1  ORF type:complete len:790 (-),score=128.39 TRINITY_DN2924_c0_g1_i1:16-2349(-)
MAAEEAPLPLSLDILRLLVDDLAQNVTSQSALQSRGILEARNLVQKLDATLQSIDARNPHCNQSVISTTTQEVGGGPKHHKGEVMDDGIVSSHRHVTSGSFPCPSETEPPRHDLNVSSPLGQTCRPQQRVLEENVGGQPRLRKTGSGASITSITTSTADNIDTKEALAQMFDAIDIGNMGEVDAVGLEKSLVEIGEEIGIVGSLLAMASAQRKQTRVITWDAWLQAVNVVVDAATSDERYALLHRLHGKQGAKRQKTCMLPPRCGFLLVWQSLLILLLFYIAVVVVFLISFWNGEEQPWTRVLSSVIDVTFACDLILNFFIGIEAPDGTIVMDWKLTAKLYLRSWFLVDLVSMVPLEVFLSDDQFASAGGMFKLLKLSRVSKGLRTLKFCKLPQLMSNTGASDHVTGKLKLGVLLLWGLLVTHWLACLMAFDADDRFLSTDTIDKTSMWSRYVACYYWALTTISTVGYGDITPATDVQRVVAMVAMVLGGTFYAAVIGAITSYTSTCDAKEREYHDRLDRIIAWLDYHDFPANVRLKINQYFEASFRKRRNFDDTAILNAMSPELREEASLHLVHATIRGNFLFSNLPESMLSSLFCILKEVSVEQSEHIVRCGDVGGQMYVIRSGMAKLETPLTQDRVKHNILCSGDSFGEEVLLSLAETYSYSVTATVHSILFTISEADFTKTFETAPGVVEQMRQDYIGMVSKRKHLKEHAHVHRVNPIAEVLPLGFAHTVIHLLEGIHRMSYESMKTSNSGASMKTSIEGDRPIADSDMVCTL